MDLNAVQLRAALAAESPAPDLPALLQNIVSRRAGIRARLAQLEPADDGAQPPLLAEAMRGGSTALNEFRRECIGHYAELAALDELWTQIRTRQGGLA
jgi:hypothetical protein